jgi:HEAT repeat protein
MRLGATVALTLLGVVSAISQATQPAALPDLLDQFEKEPIFWKQIEVAKQIVAAKDASVLPRLEPWLKHENLQLRGNAAFIFAGLGDRRGFDVIVSMLLDRSRPPKSQTARSKREIVLAQAVENQYRENRYYAAHLLGDLKDPRAIPILVPLLQDPEVNHIVPWSLAQIGGASVVPPLIGTLSDPHPNMRILAIAAIADLKASEALPRLRQLLDDHARATIGGAQTVADAAKDAIAKIQATNPR